MKHTPRSADPRAFLDEITEFFRRTSFSRAVSSNRSPSGLAGPEASGKVIRAGGRLAGSEHAWRAPD